MLFQCDTATVAAAEGREEELVDDDPVVAQMKVVLLTVVSYAVECQVALHQRLVDEAIALACFASVALASAFHARCSIAVTVLPVRALYNGCSKQALQI